MFETPVKAPIAKTANGRAVPIEEWPKGALAFCLNCGHPMAAKQGKVNRWHFAHYPNAPYCNNETALHYWAKEYMYLGISRAMEAEAPYYVTGLCSKTRHRQRYNLAIHSTLFKPESARLGPYTPDIRVDNRMGQTAIEVVVKHPTEPAKREYYNEQGHPLIEVWPTPQTVEGYVHGITDATITNQPPCVRCHWLELATITLMSYAQSLLTPLTAKRDAQRLAAELARKEKAEQESPAN